MDEIRLIKYKRDSNLYARRIYSDRLKDLTLECPQCPHPPEVIHATGEMFLHKLTRAWNVVYSCPIHGEIRKWTPEVEFLTREVEDFAYANKRNVPEYYLYTGRPVKIEWTEGKWDGPYVLNFNTGEFELNQRLHLRLTKADNEDVEAVSEEEFFENVMEIRKLIASKKSE